MGIIDNATPAKVWLNRVLARWSKHVSCMTQQWLFNWTAFTNPKFRYRGEHEGGECWPSRATYQRIRHIEGHEDSVNRWFAGPRCRTAGNPDREAGRAEASVFNRGFFYSARIRLASAQGDDARALRIASTTHA